MNEIHLKAPAKINLTLDILSRRPNGYHNLDSIFQTVSIYDYITVSKADSGVSMSCSNPVLPTDERNICVRAAKLFFESFGGGGAHIFLDKRIPFQAGLGGGSSDAAAVLLALSRIYGVDSDLHSVALTLGADVPFFLDGGTARMRGIGEIIKPLECDSSVFYVVVKPDTGNDTAATYRNLDALSDYPHTDNDAAEKALLDGNIKRFGGLCVNSFEAVADESTSRIISALLDSGAEFAHLSGSGSAVYGCFFDENTAALARDALAVTYPFSELCVPARSIELCDCSQSFFER